jgi:hypothetical protein
MSLLSPAHAIGTPATRNVPRSAAPALVTAGAQVPCEATDPPGSGVCRAGMLGPGRRGAVGVDVARTLPPGPLDVTPVVSFQAESSEVATEEPGQLQRADHGDGNHDGSHNHHVQVGGPSQPAQKGHRQKTTSGNCGTPDNPGHLTIIRRP